MKSMQQTLSSKRLRSLGGTDYRSVRILGAMCLALGSLAYSSASQAADEPENVKIVRQYLDAWNSGRSEAIENVLDSNVVYFNTSNEVPRTGPQAITEVSQFLMKILPDRKMEIRSQPVASGDGVAVEWEFTATKKNNGEASPSSANISYFGASFFRVENGKIVYASDYYNHNTMQTQLQQ
ncbi:nuclear transport factor 2 family protein [Achromobacter xylosoxidans]|uniref:nuclear transport factor 2 family protein n=1 Tax=Alcaligenes xylosoxydans xylosoxydans TaxID=85698 RepID=UPI001EEEF161|nr:nuclear transport factor 2 family protein [Achromobacter xylosoxidans]